MNEGHPDLGPELRQLAQTLLERLDPAVRAAAAMAARNADGPGRCQQVWCPVCALVALVTGEEHPLIGVIAEHSVALLAVVRALLDAGDAAGAGPVPQPDGPDGGGTDESAPASRRYQPIHITVQE